MKVKNFTRPSMFLAARLNHARKIWQIFLKFGSDSGY
jgi:hypothetical protein